MTLPLELGQVSDPVARRALEQVSLNWNSGGVPGPAGPTGPAGPQGDPGADGAPGPAGPASFVFGTGAPTAGAGVDGGAYLDLNTGRLYGPKAAGVWPSSPVGIVVRDATTYAQLASGS